MRLGLSGDMAPACELLCAEDADSLDDVADAEFPDDSGESIAGFIEGGWEHSLGCDYQDRLRCRSLDPFARAESIAWILKVHSYYSFCPLTAYLAVNYMDRFLSSHCLPRQQANEWALQLLAVTCLSLAAKMEETLVPSLLDLQVEVDKYIFKPRTILRMELLVLTALNWRLRSVTPFTFIDFFAYRVDPYGKYMKYLVSRAAQIILATIHDIDFMDHCPSSMAAAAIICAADETPALEFVNPAIASTWCTGLTEEGIRSCYQLMQQIAICSIQRRHPVVLLSQIRVTTTVNLGSSPPSKRRKLSNGGG